MRISVEEAAKLLISGKVVGVPTETVYGLAACVANEFAVADIYALKGRPANNPLIIHLSHFEQIYPYLKEIPPHFEVLAKNFWPGSLTLVLPIKEGEVPMAVRAGLSTAAFRIPKHELARRLIELTGPLVMPSANLSGSPSSTTYEHVESDFGEHFPVLDGGPCHRGVESTILYWQNEEKNWKLARLGAIAPESFKCILGDVPVGVKVEQAPLCPGQLYRHYAPKAILKRISDDIQGVVIGFDDRDYGEGGRLLSLGNSNDPETAINRLYAILRRLDQESVTEAYVDMNFPEIGLWMTLRERLEKAAGGRDGV